MMLVDEFRTAAATMAHLAADIPTASRRMDEMRAGYPARTVGASAATSNGTALTDDRPPDPDRDVRLTAVEAAAITPDRVECDTLEVRALLTEIAAKVRRLDDLCTPYKLTPTTARSQALGEAPKDWCTSCYRDGQHHEPVGLKRDGTAYYTGLCRWCGDFNKAHGVLPSRKLLEYRHEGRRITDRMVEQSIRKGRS